MKVTNNEQLGMTCSEWRKACWSFMTHHKACSIFLRMNTTTLKYMDSDQFQNQSTFTSCKMPWAAVNWSASKWKIWCDIVRKAEVKTSLFLESFSKNLTSNRWLCEKCSSSKALQSKWILPRGVVLLRAWLITALNRTCLKYWGSKEDTDVLHLLPKDTVQRPFNK